MGFESQVLGPFNLFIEPLVMLLMSCGLLGEIILKILKAVPLLIRVLVSVLNPIVFLKDLVSGIFLAFDEIIKALIDMTFGKLTQSKNKLYVEKHGLMKDGVFNAQSSSICIKPTMFHIIMMILCPPFALFMKYGFLRGWFFIIICGFLTYYYYFPGLIYACLHILCI